MRIIGCDLHATKQTIAMLDRDSGKVVIEAQAILFVEIAKRCQPDFIVSDEVLTEQFLGEKGDWKELDTWDRRLPGSANSKRAFVDGKFGFYVPQDDEIELTNFTFIPAGGR